MVRALFLAVLAAALAAAAWSQTTLKPGDVITLTCEEDASLDSDYTINDQGLLFIKYIGAVEVQGLTHEQAAQKVSRELVRQQVMPKATIAIRPKGAAAPTQQTAQPVHVGGAVRNVGEFRFTQGMTLADALNLAEVTAVADLRNVRITRLTGEVGTIDFTQFQAGNAAGNPMLRPGDRIFVPLRIASFEVTVLGAVMRPGIIEYAEQMTVRRAIERAGGLRSDANPQRIEVTPPDGASFIYNFETAADRQIDAGTRIVVGVREVRQHVFVRGPVARTGQLPYRTGMKLTDAIFDSQPLESAQLNRVRLTRRDATGKVMVQVFDVYKIQSGNAVDVELLPDDQIDVPYAAKAFRSDDTFKFVALGLLLYFVFFRR